MGARRNDSISYPHTFRPRHCRLHRTTPVNQTIILIADFQGNDQKSAVTQFIINRMKRAVNEFPEVEIKPLGQVIKEGTDSETVRRIGAEHKASIVVWGFYDEALNGTVHIDQLRQTSSFSLRRNELDFNLALPEGRRISVQEALSGDTSLLVLLVVGVARYDAGYYGEAINRFTKALDQQHSSKSESEVADVKFFLGKSLYQKGKYSEAEDRLREVVLKRDDDPDLLVWLGLALSYAARYVEAEQLYKRAMEIRDKVPRPENSDTARSLSNLALLCDLQEKYAEAEALYGRALEIREKALGPWHPDTARIIENLILLHKRQGRCAEAEPTYRRAVGIREQSVVPERPDTASLNRLAELSERQGKYAEAETLYKRTLAFYESALGPEHPYTAAILKNYAALMRKLNCESEAAKLEARAEGIREKTNRK